MTNSKLHELSHSERQAQLRRTLDKSDELNRFFIGHLLFNIQDQLFRHSLLWELQDWERADQVLKEFWYIRATIPALVAYMIVRGYMRGIVWDDLEFTNVMWHKACKASPLPYAAQSWILVQKKDFGRALTLLSEACKTVKNET